MLLSVIIESSLFWHHDPYAPNFRTPSFSIAHSSGIIKKYERLKHCFIKNLICEMATAIRNAVMNNAVICNAVISNAALSNVVLCNAVIFKAVIRNGVIR